MSLMNIDLILSDENRPLRHLVTTELRIHRQDSPRADRHRVQPQRFLQSQLAEPCGCWHVGTQTQWMSSFAIWFEIQITFSLLVLSGICLKVR